MPWHTERQGSQWCVVKDATGEVEGCHDAQQKAYGQMSALYASEDKQAAVDYSPTADQMAPPTQPEMAPQSLTARVARLEHDHAMMYAKIGELEQMLTRSVVGDLSPMDLPEIGVS